MISVGYNFSPWSQPRTTIKVMRSLLNLCQDSLMVLLSRHHLHIFVPRSFHRLPLRCHFLPRSYFREKSKQIYMKNMKFNIFVNLVRNTSTHFFIYGNIYHSVRFTNFLINANRQIRLQHILK